MLVSGQLNVVQHVYVNNFGCKNVEVFSLKCYWKKFWPDQFSVIFFVSPYLKKSLHFAYSVKAEKICHMTVSTYILILKSDENVLYVLTWLLSVSVYMFLYIIVFFTTFLFWCWLAAQLSLCRVTHSEDESLFQDIYNQVVDYYLYQWIWEWNWSATDYLKPPLIVNCNLKRGQKNPQGNEILMKDQFLMKGEILRKILTLLFC